MTTLKSGRDRVTELWLRHFMPPSLVDNCRLKYIAECDEADRASAMANRNTKRLSVLTGSQAEGLALPEYIMRGHHPVHRQQPQLVTRDRDEMILESNKYEILHEVDGLKNVLRGKMFETDVLDEGEANYVRLKITDEYKEACLLAGTPLKVNGYFPNTELPADVLKSWQRGLAATRSIPWDLEMHGPSLTFLRDGKDERDICRGIHFDSWPEVSANFRSRVRRSAWPDARLVEDAIGCGYHVAPVGRKESADCELEWRYSFSLAERHLARRLPKGSPAVYAYIKLLHTFYFKKPSGLATYYLKNLFYWVCEKVPQEAWSEKRILSTVQYFLDELIHAMATGVIPHYFIPTANLISALNVEFRMSLAKTILHVKDNLLEVFLAINQQFFFLSVFSRRPLDKLFHKSDAFEKCNETQARRLQQDSLLRLLENEIETLRSIVDIKKKTQGAGLLLQRQANENAVCHLVLGTVVDLYELQESGLSRDPPDFLVYMADAVQTGGGRIDLVVKILLQQYLTSQVTHRGLTKPSLQSWLHQTLRASSWMRGAGSDDARRAIDTLEQDYLDLIDNAIVFRKLAQDQSGSLWGPVFQQRDNPYDLERLLGDQRIGRNTALPAGPPAPPGARMNQGHNPSSEEVRRMTERLTQFMRRHRRFNPPK